MQLLLLSVVNSKGVNWIDFKAFTEFQYVYKLDYSKSDIKKVYSSKKEYKKFVKSVEKEIDSSICRVYDSLSKKTVK